MSWLAGLCAACGLALDPGGAAPSPQGSSSGTVSSSSGDAPSGSSSGDVGSSSGGSGAGSSSSGDGPSSSSGGGSNGSSSSSGGSSGIVPPPPCVAGKLDLSEAQVTYSSAGVSAVTLSLASDDTPLFQSLLLNRQRTGCEVLDAAGGDVAVVAPSLWRASFDEGASWELDVTVVPRRGLVALVFAPAGATASTFSKLTQWDELPVLLWEPEKNAPLSWRVGAPDSIQPDPNAVPSFGEAGLASLHVRFEGGQLIGFGRMDGTDTSEVVFPGALPAGLRQPVIAGAGYACTSQSLTVGNHMGVHSAQLRCVPPGAP